MSSDLPKVLHAVADRPMVAWVVDACREVGCSRIILVVGHGHEQVRAAFDSRPDVSFTLQQPQLGTGHAVQVAESVVLTGDVAGDTLILAGDGPLIHADTLRTLIARHRDTHAAATLATAVIDDPTGYGRIVRDDDRRFAAIVEEKNCTEKQRAIREVNPSYYCFATRDLFDALGLLKRDAHSGEYYITDVPAILLDQGKRVEVVDAVPPRDVLSINTPEQLAEVDRILRSRLESVA